MQITTADQQRVLEYVRMLNAGGYRPLPSEVEEWLLRPGRLPGAKGKLISPGVPAESPPLMQWWMRDNEALQRIVDTASGAATLRGLAERALGFSGSGFLSTAGTPARYEPDGPPEEFIQHMKRLGWLTADDGERLSLTDLSRALLRSERLDEDDDSSVLILSADDPSAWPRVVGHVAGMGSALVVDPYLRPEQLHALLTHTDANRFLLGHGLSNGLKATMAVMVSGRGPEGPELREALPGSIHDRYFVSMTEVWTIGTSLNAVGAGKTTMLMPLPEEAADHIRGILETAWDRASALLPPPPETAAPDEPGPVK